jgi:hypothetical protein
MNGILGIRISRRVLAVVVVVDEGIAFHDARYVTARRASVDAAMRRYFQRLLEQLTPTAIYYYAPTTTQTLTKCLIDLLAQTASHLMIPVHSLPKVDVFGALGITKPRTRRELQDRLQELWPALTEASPAHRVSLSEAAVSALLGDIRQVLPA